MKNTRKEIVRILGNQEKGENKLARLDEFKVTRKFFPFGTGEVKNKTSKDKKWKN